MSLATYESLIGLREILEASILSFGLSRNAKGVYISGRERKSGPKRVGGVAGGSDDVSDSQFSEESVSSGV